tara:strand:+ start:1731 stop:1955 length:225 start_codon:yes stop_codon:yes gene_type:complete
MIIFEGDYVTLSNSKNNWLEVDEIITGMYIRLSNGQTVEASDKHIKGVRSADEMKSILEYMSLNKKGLLYNIMV